MTLGERIQAARKKANLKQTDLAEMIGSSVVTVGQYERDKRQPRLEQLARIADALNVTVGYLQGEETIDAKQIVEALQKRDNSSLESLLGLDAGSILAIGQEQIASLESQRITENIARRAGLTIKDSQGNVIHQGDGKPWVTASDVDLYHIGALQFHSDEDRISFFYKQLNTDGMLAASKCFLDHLKPEDLKEVADYVEKLVQTPQYQRPQEADENKK